MKRKNRKRAKKGSPTNLPQNAHAIRKTDAFDFASLEKMIANTEPFDPGCPPHAFRAFLREIGEAADPPLMVRVKQPGTGHYIVFIEDGRVWKKHDAAESGQ